MSIRIFSTPRSATMSAFVILFSGFALWAMFTDLDYGSHAEGKIASSIPNVQIQHNAFARVAQVEVNEGDVVKKGQPLLMLEDSDALAESVGLESQRLSLILQFEAALAEWRGSTDFPCPVVTQNLLPQDVVQQSCADVKAALRQRLSSHQAQMKQIADDIRVAESQLRLGQESLQKVDIQLGILSRQTKAMESMLEERLVARSAVEDQLMRLEDLRRAKNSLLSDQERLKGVVIQSENKQRIYLAGRENDLKGRIADMAPKLKGAEQSSTAAAVKRRSLAITAPVDGQIVNLKVKSAGEVIGSGMIVMEVVPTARKYFVSARVLPAEIENLYVGTPAEIHFVTLPSKSTPRVNGRLVSIASDATTDEKSGQTYYIASIEFAGNVAKEIGMEPILGMPVQALLKGGRRSVMSYIIDPFKVLITRAMKEQ